MKDYWSKLKLNECWSEKQRYNLIMNMVLDNFEGEDEEPLVEEETLNPVGGETPPAMEEEEED